MRLTVSLFRVSACSTMISASGLRRLKIVQSWLLGRRSPVGSKNSYIATLVERRTRYVTLMKIANKATQTVILRIIDILPSDFYFCDPHGPWHPAERFNTCVVSIG